MTVLRGVDLAVAPGASVVVGGANGAGKTTLLRVLATLLRPSAGTGTVDGLDLVDGAEAIRERLTYVSARGFLYDELTAAENLRFAARLVGASISPAGIAGLLAAAGLEHAGKQPVRTYSTGMRRRLSLIALRLRPIRLALLDEPYAGLDAEGVTLADRIVSGLREAGTAVVMASHQSGEATRLADRTLLLEEGRLNEVTPGGGGVAPGGTA